MSKVHQIVGVSQVFLLFSMYHQLKLKELVETDGRVQVLEEFAFALCVLSFAYFCFSNGSTILLTLLHVLLLDL